MTDASTTNAGTGLTSAKSNNRTHRGNAKIPLALCYRIVAWAVVFAIAAALTMSPAASAMVAGGFSGDASTNTSSYVSGVSGIVLYFVFCTTITAFEKT